METVVGESYKETTDTDVVVTSVVGVVVVSGEVVVIDRPGLNSAKGEMGGSGRKAQLVKTFIQTKNKTNSYGQVRSLFPRLPTLPSHRLPCCKP